MRVQVDLFHPVLGHAVRKADRVAAGNLVNRPAYVVCDDLGPTAVGIRQPKRCRSGGVTENKQSQRVVVAPGVIAHGFDLRQHERRILAIHRELPQALG